MTFIVLRAVIKFIRGLTRFRLTPCFILIPLQLRLTQRAFLTTPTRFPIPLLSLVNKREVKYARTSSSWRWTGPNPFPPPSHPFQ